MVGAVLESGDLLEAPMQHTMAVYGLTKLLGQQKNLLPAHGGYWLRRLVS